MFLKIQTEHKTNFWIYQLQIEKRLTEYTTYKEHIPKEEKEKRRKREKSWGANGYKIY